MDQPTRPEDLKGFEFAVTKTMSVLGAPIRGLYNVIGNSTVAAASVIGIFFAVAVVSALITFGESINEAYLGLARQENAVARERELNNSVKEKTVFAVGRFGPIVAYYVNVTDVRGEGIVIKFYPVANAVAYEMKYQVDTINIDLLTLANPVVNADGVIEWYLPKTGFVTTWSSQRLFQFLVFARDAGGGRASASNWDGVRIP
jgi:hypothetical protein